jgi:hypothetical protein
MSVQAYRPGEKVPVTGSHVAFKDGGTPVSDAFDMKKLAAGDTFPPTGGKSRGGWVRMDLDPE